MQHLSFLVAGRSFAIPSSLVVEVIPPVAGTAVAGLPGWISGCIRYRGGIVPVVDLAHRLAAEAGAPPTRPAVTPARLGTRVIVVETASDDDPRPLRLGIRVDAVLDLIRIRPRTAPFAARAAAGSHADPEGRDSPPSVPSWIGSVVVHEGRTIQLLEPRGMLPAPVASQLFPSAVPASARAASPAARSGEDP